MEKRDLKASLIIGVAVGLLIQPILANYPSTAHLNMAARGGIFIFFTLFAPFALWLCRIVSQWWKGIYQFGQFAAVGTLNTFIDLGIFNLELFLYGTPFIGNALFATFKTVSFLCATTNSFVWNKYWTFNAREKPKAGEAFSFYGVAIAGWIINVGVATLVKSAGSQSSGTWISLVAPMCGVAASFLWDFFGYKYLVFRKKEDLHPAGVVV